MAEVGAVGCIIVAITMLLVLVRLAGIEHRLASISRLDAKLDAVLRHAGVDFDPYKSVHSAVADALERGEKIEAIKHYRAATGVGLKEAKEYVEELQRRSGRSA